MLSSGLRAIGLVLACTALSSHARRVKISSEKAHGRLSDAGKGSQRLVDKHTARAASLAEVKKSLLQQMVDPLSPFRKLAVLLLASNPATAWQVPGPSRSFATLQHGRAPVLSGTHARVVMQADGAESGTWKPPAITDRGTEPIKETWRFELDEELRSMNLEESELERVELLQGALDDKVFLEDVCMGLLSFPDDAFMQRHPEAVEKLLPQSAESRADLLWLMALRRHIPASFEIAKNKIAALEQKITEKQAAIDTLDSEIKVLNEGRTKA